LKKYNVSMEVRRRILLHLLLVAVVSAGLYAHTLDSSFLWDEERLVFENPFVTDRTLIFGPSSAAGHEWHGTVLRRHVGYFTFWANYRLHGADLTGYHVFNLAVHVLNSILVYWLVALLFRTPGLKESPLAARGGTVALWSALLFAAHPVQIEAVTYIFQRHASLVGLFWLLAVCSYLRWRVGGRWGWYALALISVLFAMKTKENAFMLPPVIALAEFVFFRGKKGMRVLWLVPLLLAMLIVPFSLVGADSLDGDVLAGLGEEASLGDPVDEVRAREYMLAQVRVAATYLRLFLFPVNQNLDYDYPRYTSFTLSVVLGLMLHAALWAFAGWAFLRGARKRPEWLLVGFGIAWFYVALIVESSFIPIPMVITEYRMYIPLTGLAAACVTLMHLGLEGRANVLKAVLVTLAVALSVLTVQRNALWTTPIPLWEDTLQKSPWKARVHFYLGYEYGKAGRLEGAEQKYKAALTLNPYYGPAFHHLGMVYLQTGRRSEASALLRAKQAGGPGLPEDRAGQADVFMMHGWTDKAVEDYPGRLGYDPGLKNEQYRRANIYMERGMFEQAVEHFRAVLDMAPGEVDAHVNIAVAYMNLGEADKSISHLREAIRYDPDFKSAHYNLANIYTVRGRFKEAAEHYRAVLDMEPGDVNAHVNLAVVYYRLGQADMCIRHLREALEIAPEDREAHFNLGIALRAKGLEDEAGLHFAIAERLGREIGDKPGE
jgi:tetratricopeptide (TPR) repeat protein